jgi:hypothetical protein
MAALQLLSWLHGLLKILVTAVEPSGSLNIRVLMSSLPMLLACETTSLMLWSLTNRVLSPGPYPVLLRSTVPLHSCRKRQPYLQYLSS